MALHHLDMAQPAVLDDQPHVAKATHLGQSALDLIDVMRFKS